MNAAQYRGLGPDARLIGLRVLDEHGAGETSQVIQAIEFAIAQRDTLGIDVINLSLGHPIYEPAATDPLVRAVERAVDAGIIVVASAGNFGYNARARGAPATRASRRRATRRRLSPWARCGAPIP